VRFDELGAGVTYTAHRDLADGRSMDRVSTWMLPNVMFVPDVAMRPGRPNGIGVAVPVDDSHCRILMSMRSPVTPDGKRPMRGLEAENFKPWHMFIPLLGIYFLWVKVPEQVGKAKQMAGSRNPQASGIVLYIFLSYYALAKDLNEVWSPQS